MLSAIYVRHDGRTVGPLKSAEVIELVRQGCLPPALDVSADGVRWQSALVDEAEVRRTGDAPPSLPAPASLSPNEAPPAIAVSAVADQPSISPRVGAVIVIGVGVFFCLLGLCVYLAAKAVFHGLDPVAEAGRMKVLGLLAAPFVWLGIWTIDWLWDVLVTQARRT